MIIALTMPQFGESITEGHLVRWLKNAGDTVAEAEPIVEMETEKSVFSHESPFKGKIVKLLAEEGANVPVGQVIAHFDVSAEDGKKYLDLGVAQPVDGSGTPIEKPKVVETKTEEIKAAPVAKPSTSVTPSAAPGVTIVNITPIRARIAEKMVLSKTTIPHAGTGLDVDLGKIDQWRKANENPPSYLIFALFTVLHVIKKYPLINSSWKESGGKKWIEQYDDVNLGVAVATKEGLMVPSIKKANTLSFKQLQSAVAALIESARNGNLKVEELTGATFTVNNTGSLGSYRTSQVIPPPQVAIMALNKVVKKPVAVSSGEGEMRVAIRPIMSLDLAFDHRVIDGDYGIGFVDAVAKELESFDFSQIT
ncbi:MAG: 2-oxo acid dehydrogenase subunit E2 [Deltaproteobacteria bacterium]|nr:MAG: 2-oxo acid dehydrogenase subunit E2 [Deltaproteobacteria bacterium]